jgi:hypothetical protein
MWRLGSVSVERIVEDGFVRLIVTVSSSVASQLAYKLSSAVGLPSAGFEKPPPKPYCQ